MTPDDLKQVTAKILDEIQRYREEDLPHVVGYEAVDHFQDSFIQEGFTDKTLQKWQEVERRKPESPWYGFSRYDKNQFSETRTADKILKKDGDLRDSIEATVKPDRVSVGTDKKYAAVHQFGQGAKIFGKKSFTMKARPFIGKSEVLINKIMAQVNQDLEKIIKQ